MIVFAGLPLSGTNTFPLAVQRSVVETGAMGRVAYLLVTLVLVQLLFPAANIWAISAGVAVAYGIPFVLQLKRQYRAAR